MHMLPAAHVAPGTEPSYTTHVHNPRTRTRTSGKCASKGCARLDAAVGVCRLALDVEIGVGCRANVPRWVEHKARRPFVVTIQAVPMERKQSRLFDVYQIEL